MRLSVSYICMLGYVLSSKRVSRVSGMVWPARYQNAIETMNCPTELTWTLGKPRHTCPCWILLFRKFSDIQINIKCTCKSSLKLAEGTKDIIRSQQSNREFCFSPSTISTTWVVPWYLFIFQSRKRLDAPPLIFLIWVCRQESKYPHYEYLYGCA